VSNASTNPTNVQISGNGTLKTVFAAKIIFYTLPEDVGGVHWGNLSNPLHTNKDFIYGFNLLPDYTNNITAYAESILGYSFQYWDFTGNLSLDDGNRNPVNCTFTGPCTLTAIYNAVPVVTWIHVKGPGGRVDPGGEVGRGSGVRFLTYVSDVETASSDLSVAISFRSPGGSWVELSGATYHSSWGCWYGDWVIPVDAVLGLYDVMVNVTDLEGGDSWMMDTGEFNVIE
jgi:hypothetical protein